MKILHKEGHSITIWVYSDDGLPLYPIIVQSETVTELNAAQQNMQRTAMTEYAIKSNCQCDYCKELRGEQ